MQKTRWRSEEPPARKHVMMIMPNASDFCNQRGGVRSGGGGTHLAPQGHPASARSTHLTSSLPSNSSFQPLSRPLPVPDRDPFIQAQQTNSLCYCPSSHARSHVHGPWSHRPGAPQPRLPFSLCLSVLRLRHCLLPAHDLQEARAAAERARQMRHTHSL